MRLKIFGAAALILAIIGGYVYFRYFFREEDRNVTRRSIENITGQNLTITVFSFDGKIVKRWTGIKKITSGKEGREYTYFYTSDNRYVQLPNSVWYIAEEE